LEKRLKVRRRVKMSAQRIKEARMRVNSTLIKDMENDKIYRFPSRPRQDSREIYAALGLKREVTPTEITLLMKYRRRVPNFSESLEGSEVEGQPEV
ncbi:MAG: hypothetical protein LBD04_03615, partial [Synergistaceae bacterium]|nr:hypothetical protein [Synergistaceae bacterium]